MSAFVNPGSWTPADRLMNYAYSQGCKAQRLSDHSVRVCFAGVWIVCTSIAEIDDYFGLGMEESHK